MHIIKNDDNNTVYFLGLLNQHMNKRRMKKKQQDINSYTMRDLGADVPVRNHKMAQLSKRLPKELKHRHIKGTDYGSTGYEAGKHYLGYVDVIPKVNGADYNLDKSYDDAMKHYRIVHLKCSDYDTDHWLKSRDIATDGKCPVAAVIFNPHQKNDVFLMYTKMGRDLDKSEQFYNETYDYLTRNNIKRQRLVIIGPPKSGKQTLKRYLKNKYHVNSIIASRIKALKLKKKYKKQVSILICRVNYKHTLLHRLMKTGYSYQESWRKINEYYNQNVELDDYYDEGFLDDCGHDALCNQLTDLHVRFD